MVGKDETVWVCVRKLNCRDDCQHDRLCGKQYELTRPHHNTVNPGSHPDPRCRRVFSGITALLEKDSPKRRVCSTTIGDGTIAFSDYAEANPFFGRQEKPIKIARLISGCLHIRRPG